MVVGLGAALGVRAATGGAPAPAARSAAGRPAAAPGGTLTLLDHQRVSLASLRSRPVMVWFVAGGCASCAASIPVVASHLGAFTKAGTLVGLVGLSAATRLQTTGTITYFFATRQDWLLSGTLAVLAGSGLWSVRKLARASCLAAEGCDMPAARSASAAPAGRSEPRDDRSAEPAPGAVAGRPGHGSGR